MEPCCRRVGCDDCNGNYDKPAYVVKKGRSCTDLPVCFAFLAFVGILSGVVYQKAIRKGDINTYACICIVFFLYSVGSTFACVDEL